MNGACLGVLHAQTQQNIVLCHVCLYYVPPKKGLYMVLPLSLFVYIMDSISWVVLEEKMYTQAQAIYRLRDRLLGRYSAKRAEQGWPSTRGKKLLTVCIAHVFGN